MVADTKPNVILQLLASHFPDPAPEQGFLTYVKSQFGSHVTQEVPLNEKPVRQLVQLTATPLNVQCRQLVVNPVVATPLKVVEALQFTQIEFNPPL